MSPVQAQQLQSHQGERLIFGRSTQPCPPANVRSGKSCFAPQKTRKCHPLLQREERNDLRKAQSWAELGVGFWGFQSPSSIPPPLRRRGKWIYRKLSKAPREFREAKLSSFSLSLECPLIPRALPCSSPAHRNGTCWKIWSTRGTCKIKPQTVGSYQYLSKPKNKGKNKNKKKINPVTNQKCHFRNFTCHVWWN